MASEDFVEEVCLNMTKIFGLSSRSNLPLSTFEDTFLLEIMVLNVS